MKLHVDALHSFKVMLGHKKDFQFYNGESQALEKEWLFSVPLHPMLILWKHIKFMFLEFQKHQARNIFQQYLNMSAVHLCTI